MNRDSRELLYILMAPHVCLHVDHSELGRRQPALSTARREGRTRLDTLAGGG